MAVNLSLLAGAGWQFFDDNGDPLTGGRLFTYAAGTTTPLVTYTSSSGATPNTNPIILNAAGRLSGSGEIWLTEGVLYKFVLTDANNVLIGTYDNVSGATDGSSIYAALANTADPAKGDALVGFRQSNNSGNLPGSVGRTVHQKLQEIVSLKDFGAVGDGVADDTAALTAAFNSSSYTTIDGDDKTYRITAPITVATQHIVIQNMTIDMSGVPNQGSGTDFIISFIGTQGGAVNLTANLLANTNVVTVGSTASFSADQYVWIQSNRVFWSPSSTVGQFAKIKTINSATTMTLYDGVLYDFTTADTARISPVTPKENITLQNVSVLGAQAHTQAAFRFQLCADVTLKNCSFERVDYACVYVDRSINVVNDGVRCRHSRWVSPSGTDGLSYGILFLNGVYNCTVVNGYSEDQRHYVATGAVTTDGGVNLYVTVANNHVVSARNAGIDAHPPTDFYTAIGNTVEQTPAASGTLDGIICQGLNCVIANNIVVGATRHAVFHQILTAFGVGSSVLTGNLIRSSGGGSVTSFAVYAANETTGTAVINGVNISNNVISGAPNFHIGVTAIDGAISNVSVTGNVSCENALDTACRIRAQGTATPITDVVVANNVFKTDAAGSQNLYLLGTSSSPISRVSVTGNVVNGGINGLRAAFVNGVTYSNNQLANVTTPVLITDSTSVVLDNRTEGVRTVTGATYTVAVTDADIVANRAGTITLTLPDPATSRGRVLNVKTVQPQAVVSATANVVPIDDTVAGTAILGAVDGAWAQLKCDGTNWVVMARG